MEAQINQSIKFYFTNSENIIISIFWFVEMKIYWLLKLQSGFLPLTFPKVSNIKYRKKFITQISATSVCLTTLTALPDLSVCWRELSGLAPSTASSQISNPSARSRTRPSTFTSSKNTNKMTKWVRRRNILIYLFNIFTRAFTNIRIQK